MHIRIRALVDNRIIDHFDTAFVPRWPRTQESVADWAGCDPDDVHEIETDDGDVITANGIPFARTERKWGWQILGAGEWA